MVLLKAGRILVLVECLKIPIRWIWMDPGFLFDDFIIASSWTLTVCVICPVLLCLSSTRKYFYDPCLDGIHDVWVAWFHIIMSASGVIVRWYFNIRSAIDLCNGRPTEQRIFRHLKNSASCYFEKNRYIFTFGIQFFVQSSIGRFDAAFCQSFPCGIEYG